MTAPTTPDEGLVEGGPAPAGRGRFALPDDPNRRALTIGAVALAVLLLLFVASRVLLGGGVEEEDPQEAAPSRRRPPPATTTTLADGTGRPDESFEVFSTKNPFTPLINPPSRSAAGGGTTSGGATSGGGTTGGTTSGGGATATTRGPSGGGSTQTTIRGGSGSGASTTTQPGGSSGGPANEPRRQQRVALLDVLRREGRLVAQVRVNDTVYTVGEGDVFADNYRVLSIDEANECGRFIFGDEQFRLCRGEETLK